MGALRFLLFLATATQLLMAMTSAKSVAKPHQQAQFVDYLTKYGYLQAPDPRLGKINTDSDLREAVKKIQALMNLPVTGDLSDPETVAIMEKKRCAMSDFGPSENARRRKRYATQGTKWEKKELTYKIVNYTPDLTKEEVDQTIDKAIAMWASASALKFTKIDTDSDIEADIMIKFVRGYHGDSRPSDGKGKELAHAFFPLDNTGLAGDVHFDEDEQFTLLNVNEGVDLLWLAVHELGHSLGLDHAYHPDSIMFPFYLGYTSNLQLDVDDKNGVQSLYGMPSIERVTPTPHTDPTVAPGLPDKCSVQKVDAIVSTADKITWLFSEEHVWEIGDYGAGEALKIKEVFPDLEENIDAAYTLKRQGQTIFFKDSRFWVYENRKLITGPNSIQELGLPSDLENMDAVLEWARNGKTYFFKDDQYWRFNTDSKSIDPGYPRKIASAWRGVPESKLDGAFQWINGKTYFFKGQEYYSFDDYKVIVNPGYPRDMRKYWMGCGLSGVKLERVSSAYSATPSLALFVVTLVLAWLF